MTPSFLFKIVQASMLLTFGAQVLGQALYQYDEIWNGKPEAISATKNDFNFDVYTEVYNSNISPFADPNWQQFTHNTLLIQENNDAIFPEWGGLNPMMYRNLVHYEGRDRPKGSDPNTLFTIHVNDKMSVSNIQHIVDTAKSHTTIFFENGIYDFSKPLWIHKDDVTLRGEVDDDGKSLVVIKTYEVATISDSVAFAVDIRKPGATTIFGKNSSEANRPILTTNSQSLLKAEDSIVKLYAKDHLKLIDPGDFLVFSHEDDPFFNERSRKGLERLRSVAEVKSIDYKSSQISLKSAVGMDYNPKRPGSTNEILVVEKEDVISNVIVRDLVFQGFSEIDYAAFVDSHDLTNSRPDLMKGTAAISIKTGHEVDIINVTVENAPSTGIAINGGFEIYIDDFTFDGAINNGIGGNGYGILLADTHYTDIINFKTGRNKPVRHAVVFAFYSTSGYNNVHVQYANANADFHGGADYGNILYFDSVEVRQMDTNYPPIFDYRYEWHPRSYRAYTPPPLNQMQNTVIMTYASAQKEGNIEGYNGYDNPNDPIDDGREDRNDGKAWASSHTIHAAANGSTIYSWGGDDIVVSGAGNDLLDGGDGQDFYVFFGNSGTDVLRSFVNSEGVCNLLAEKRNEIGYSFRTKKNEDGQPISNGDKIVIKENVNNTGIKKSRDMLLRISQVGNDVHIDLGEGNFIKIEGYNASNLSAKDFVILTFN